MKFDSSNNLHYEALYSIHVKLQRLRYVNYRIVISVL
jgi:hypothetical protein